MIFRTFPWCPIWGPCDSLNHLVGVKIAKKRVFRDFNSQNGDKNTFKTFFEEKILLFSFQDTYLGPNASRIKKRCDFLPSFFQERGFVYQKSNSRGQIGAPNSTVQKYNISTFTGKKIMCVTALVQILQLKVWRKLKNVILEPSRLQIGLQKSSALPLFSKFSLGRFPGSYRSF